jgi:hypothetical protein
MRFDWPTFELEALMRKTDEPANTLARMRVPTKMRNLWKSCCKPTIQYAIEAYNIGGKIRNGNRSTSSLERK